MKCLYFAVAFILLAIPALRAQTLTIAGDVPLCRPADIDATFFFTDAPAGHETIAINLRNLTAKSCTLRRELVPSFAVDGHGAIIDSCWFCTPNGGRDGAAILRNDRFVLDGRDSAHVTYKWASTGDKCHKVDWVNFYVDWATHASFLFEANRWKPRICSTMEISGYEPGSMSSSVLSPHAEATLHVTLPPTPVYADEFAKLTVELKSPQDTIRPTGRCAELYAVYNDDAGSTRFEPIYPDGFGTLINNATGGRGVYVSGYPNDLPAEFKNYTRLCDTLRQASSTVVTLPASMQAPIHVFPQPAVGSLRHLVWRAVSTDTKQPVFVTADVHFTVLDPAKLPANWGEQVKGIGVGLSVDRASFILGEAIPLHLHWENFAATEKLAATECGEPRPNIELQDASHHVLETINAEYVGCMGHGWGPFSVEAGKPHHDFLNLVSGQNEEGIPSRRARISAPGIYYLIAVWSPSTLVAREIKTVKVPDALGSNYTFGERYAEARSLPVRIEILPSKN